jgi:hypothetical protein
MNQNAPMRPGTRAGLMSGFLSTLYLSILYMVDKKLVVGPAHQVAYVILMTGMVWAAFRERDLLGGYIEQKPALVTAFESFLIGSAILAFFDYALPAVFDPTLVQLAKEVELQHLESYKDQYATDKYLLIKREIENRQGGPSFFNTVFLYFFFTIPGFFVAGIISFFAKKTKVERR